MINVLTEKQGVGENRKTAHEEIMTVPFHPRLPLLLWGREVFDA